MSTYSLAALSLRLFGSCKTVSHCSAASYIDVQAPSSVGTWHLFQPKASARCRIVKYPSRGRSSLTVHQLGQRAFTRTKLL